MITSVFLICFYKKANFSVEEPVEPQVDAAPNIQQINKHLAAQSKTTIESIKMLLGSIAVDSGKNKEIAKKNLVAFKAMDNLRDNFNKEVIREKIIDELLTDSASISLAQQILLNNEFAKNLYGEDQALARVYSIKILSRLHEKGDSQFIIKTVRDLVTDFGKNQNIPVGRKEDLFDLLQAYLKYSEPKVILGNLGEELTRFGYNKQSCSSETVEIFEDAFYFSLQRKTDEKILIALLKKHISKKTI